ncbi:MAG: hypothetical protein R3E42_05480 [Burkholderiaceae bacterium]
MSHACRPGVGAAGARLLYPNGTLQHAGIVLGIGGWAGHAHKGFSSLAHGYVGQATHQFLQRGHRRLPQPYNANISRPLADLTRSTSAWPATTWTCA